MTSREQIQSTVVKYLVENIDELNPNTIDTTRSMKDLGANSLDLVEVVSRTMRELKIKVPRSQLTDLETIDGLVDILYEVSLGTTAPEGWPR